ncbi:hypothetical protein PPYR_10567 [Photinus pyralis]|uniref:Large ribosomal subunit protein mL62 n=1 Tax=Photinus pyralis TaxID=7054 RepID=A0A1Y1KMT2_PHOPY|nr:peptidyl-tRNA hydrolase ICT1, mitochondrial [Photinus pyralis]KAB0796506.1 hypothetical protein PPYR_10567 [Photinus pyralis]
MMGTKQIILGFGRRFVSYKSAIALDKLYPTSSLKLTTPKFANSADNFTGYIPMNELDVTYSKSSGPGGQNVNKVNTKVDVRFHLDSATWLTDEVKQNLKAKLKTRMNNDGFLIFRSDLTRSQQLNLADCLAKLRECIYSVMIPSHTVDEETAEHLRRRYEKAMRERLFKKRHRSQIKADRRDPVVSE